MDPKFVDAVNCRREFAGYLRQVLIGPVDGPEETIEGTPLLRYMMGMLFPPQGEIEVAEDGTSAGQTIADDDAQGGTSGARRQMPSTVGLSFLVPRDARLTCHLSAGVYEQVAAGSKRRSEATWKRVPLPAEGRESITLPSDARGGIRALHGRAVVHVNRRDWGDAASLVTVSLVNANEPTTKLDPAALLFQVAMEIQVEGGEVLPYPEAPSSATSDRDEAEVRHLYRDSPVFARGHGAAAMWDVGDDHCTRVWIEFMPSAEVRSATFEIRDDGLVDKRYRDLDFLAFHPARGEVCAVLGGLSDAFEGWVEEQEGLARSSSSEAGIGLARRARDWVGRMRKGLRQLEGAEVFKAFQLANQAMLWQMRMAEAGKEGPYSAQLNREVPALSSGLGYQWRPFQVAFFLGVLESLVDPTSNDREIVDIIWFPTGGGKTEAYLLVAAFELVRRRLANNGRDEATAVLSRYTLRMLTTQQFQRTGMLACALELLRRADPECLGTRPFTVGLWVGQSLTPNKFSKAEEHLEKWDLGRPDAPNPFLVDRCPGCGTSIVDRDRLLVGVEAGPAKFRFFCLSERCAFHQGLPMQVVDEALYRDPPSILLGTLDKFAGLAWDANPSAFFRGASGDGQPPSLVIQDELHLISGPLGSISGPYEVAIDGIIRARGNGAGPKVIASTATIRNSREQVRALYGRRSTVFPSPINRWDEAFFFRLEDQEDKPGRLYLGAMGQGTTTPVVSMVWAAAALLQAAQETNLSGAIADGYRTVLVYLNSRRELGRTITAASQEIPDRIKAIATAEDKRREIGEVMELSAQMTKDMGEAIRTLQRKGTSDAPPVGFVPCTSIISVGVDVDRLGVMLVNGQPKLTSEYIQASSRVGRSAQVPGLVLTLYSPAKPRDRSHYEDFLAYHEAVYRYVEPTSATPYAPPARERTLHAAVIALLRHASAFGANEGAGRVRFDEQPVASLLQQFKETIAAADVDESTEALAHLEQFIAEWRDQASSGGTLRYVSPGLQFPPGLIRDYGTPPALGYRPAMRSVRNVDPDVLMFPVDER